ncbi:hypothetical protein Sjap_025841 [Stephania japonica]|uniref:Reverse transcriptase zinc-binding domain-containing protein n=1 Tax=Stephania japonica TaxID=461633 RepID=A0AAP0E506_9MAGN
MHWILEPGLNHIAAQLPPVLTATEDNIYWVDAPSVEVSVVAAYEFCRKEEWCPPSNCWNLVWKWDGPERIRTFLWLVTKGDWNTPYVVVTAIHAWKRLMTQSEWENSRSQPFQDWLPKKCSLSQNPSKRLKGDQEGETKSTSDGSLPWGTNGSAKCHDSITIRSLPLAWDFGSR